MRYCKYCESPLDDEKDDLDENGKAYCECDGAEIERLGDILDACIDAMRSEYMSCPYCSGRISRSNEVHDLFCTLGQYIEERGLDV